MILYQIITTYFLRKCVEISTNKFNVDTKTIELTKDAKSLTYGKVRGSRRAERLLGIDCLFARFTDGGWAPIWRKERVLAQWAWPWGALTRVDQTDLARPQSSLIICKGPRNGCGRLLRHPVRRGPWHSCFP